MHSLITRRTLLRSGVSFFGCVALESKSHVFAGPCAGLPNGNISAIEKLGFDETIYYGKEVYDDFGTDIELDANGCVFVVGNEGFIDTEGFEASRGIVGFVDENHSRIAIVYRGLRSIDSIAIDGSNCLVAAGYTQDPKPVIQKMTRNGSICWKVTESSYGFGLAVATFLNCRIAWAYSHRAGVESGRGFITTLQVLTSSGSIIWSTVLRNESAQSLRIKSISHNQCGDVFTAGEIVDLGMDSEWPSMQDASFANGRRSGVIHSIDRNGGIRWTRIWNEDYRDLVASVNSWGTTYVMASGRAGAGAIIRKYDERGTLIKEARFQDGVIAFSVVWRDFVFAAYTTQDLKKLVVLKLNKNLQVVGEGCQSIKEVSPLDLRLAVDNTGKLWICGSRRKYRGSEHSVDVYLFVSTIVKART